MDRLDPTDESKPFGKALRAIRDEQLQDVAGFIDCACANNFWPDIIGEDNAEELEKWIDDTESTWDELSLDLWLKVPHVYASAVVLELMIAEATNA